MNGRVQWETKQVTLLGEKRASLEGPLCLCNARPEKDKEGAARCPFCSQNAHDQNVLVRCAQ